VHGDFVSVVLRLHVVPERLLHRLEGIPGLERVGQRDEKVAVVVLGLRIDEGRPGIGVSETMLPD
jgi:hypothetical protein